MGILLLHQIQREDPKPMPKPTMPIMDTIQHGTLDITIPDTSMERKREVLTQSLHRCQIQRDDLKPMPKLGMLIMDTTQLGIPGITIHTGAITTMEGKREVLTLFLRENLRLVLMRITSLTATTQHITLDTTIHN